MRTLVLGSLLVVAGSAAAQAQPDRAASPSCAPAPGPQCCPCPDQGRLGCPSGDDPPRCWAEAGYLLWWMKKAPLPAPVVTTDPSNGASPTAGGLADPTTQVLLGGSTLGSPTFYGGRARVGYRLTDDLGVEGGGFLFGAQSARSGVGSGSNGSPFLFRPVVNVDTGNLNAGLFLASPGTVAGALTAGNSTRLWGADGLFSAGLLRGDGFRHGFRLMGLAGFRYLDLGEGLTILDSRTDLAGIGVFGGRRTSPGDRVSVLDSFRTRNQLYGGALGLRGDALLGGLVLSANANVTLGCNHQAVGVNGLSTLTPGSGAAPTSLPGGLLALPSNSGRSTRNVFSVVPQVGGQIGYSLTPNVLLSVGYDFLYWNNVARPGSQINNVISAAQVPTSPTYAPGTTSVPAAPRNSTDFWAHGVNFSLALSF